MSAMFALVLTLTAIRSLELVALSLLWRETQ